MVDKQNEAAPHAEESYDPIRHLRTLAKRALVAPGELTREQIQELGYALLVATRDDLQQSASDANRREKHG